MPNPFAQRLFDGPMVPEADPTQQPMMAPVMPPPEVLVQQRAMDRANQRRARIEARRWARQTGPQGNPMLQAMFGPQDFDQALKLYGLNASLMGEQMKDRRDSMNRRADEQWKRLQFGAEQQSRNDALQMQLQELSMKQDELKDRAAQKGEDAKLVKRAMYLKPFEALGDMTALQEAMRRYDLEQEGKFNATKFDDTEIQGVSDLAMRNTEDLYRKAMTDLKTGKNASAEEADLLDMADPLVRSQLSVRGYKPEQIDALMQVFRNRTVPPMPIPTPSPRQPTPSGTPVGTTTISPAFSAPTGGGPRYYGPLW